MPTKITDHFTLDELVATQHRDKGNTPTPLAVKNLLRTALKMEVIRAVLGNHVITVTSGYRSPALNALVGGAPSSAHIFGYAVDFNCYGLGDPIAICRRLVAERETMALEWDQLIEEGSWVHLSFDPRMRGEVLTKNPAGGYYEGLPPV